MELGFADYSRRHFIFIEGKIHPSHNYKYLELKHQTDSIPAFHINC